MKKMILSLLAAGAACCALYAGQDAAPVFSLPALDGKPFVLADHLGKGYIVLNFWASWCDSCAEEVPQLAALKKSPGADKVLFVGIDEGDNARRAAKFVSKNAYPYPVILLDKDRAVAKKYGVPGLPVTVIISKDGKTAFSGPRPPKTFDFSK
jgi:thiol-disulfide isomerase/thioredoxin